MEMILKIALLIVLLYPFLDVGARWLHKWVTYRLELLEMSAHTNDNNCKSMSKVTGLCDWGTECHCFNEFMMAHQKGLEGADMFESYPSDGSTNLTNITPISKPKAENKLTDKELEELEAYGKFVNGVWVDKPNPGLVPDGTQPVEADEEPFPGFSQHGG